MTGSYQQIDTVYSHELYQTISITYMLYNLKYTSIHKKIHNTVSQESDSNDGLDLDIDRTIQQIEKGVKCSPVLVIFYPHKPTFLNTDWIEQGIGLMILKTRIFAWCKTSKTYATCTEKSLSFGMQASNHDHGRLAAHF